MNATETKYAVRFGSLIVEGWRFVPHSYAIVNMYQCLELMRYDGLRLFHRDLPFAFDHWRTAEGLIDAEADEALRRIVSCPDQMADVCLRIGYPYDLRPAAKARRTYVMITAEVRAVPVADIAGGIPLAQALSGNDTTIVTPSRWSREGIIASGAAPERVVVVPHGVDPTIYRPRSSGERAVLRQALKWENHFVFLSVGALKDKGLDELLAAFAVVHAQNPSARLVIKGLNALYGSAIFQSAVDRVCKIHGEHIGQAVWYVGGALSAVKMAALYQAADVYVSPYRAEGFNIPVLEAMACGLPIICTAGGATEDFVTDDCCLRIRSQPVSAVCRQTMGTCLLPDQGHLAELMSQIMNDEAFLDRARLVAPWRAHHDFTWERVVGRLLDVLFTTTPGDRESDTVCGA
ncbi:MAG: glycosyltransferase [Alphaproteobacteria bacterium]